MQSLSVVRGAFARLRHAHARVARRPARVLNKTHLRTVFGLRGNNSASGNPHNGGQPAKQPSGPSPMELINSIPPIVNNGNIAACDGGGGPLGHPKVFISLENATVKEPEPCMYCGLRFVSKDAVMAELEKGTPLKQGEDFLLPNDLSKYVTGGTVNSTFDEHAAHGHH